MVSSVTYRTTNRSYLSGRGRFTANINRAPLRLVQRAVRIGPVPMPALFQASRVRNISPVLGIIVGAATVAAYQWASGPSTVPVVQSNLTEGDTIGDWRVDRLFTPANPPSTPKTPGETWDAYATSSQPQLDAVPGALRNQNFLTQGAYDAVKATEMGPTFALDIAVHNTLYQQHGYDMAGPFPHQIISEVRFEAKNGLNVENPIPLRVNPGPAMPLPAPLSTPSPAAVSGYWGWPSPTPYGRPQVEVEVQPHTATERQVQTEVEVIVTVTASGAASATPPRSGGAGKGRSRKRMRENKFTASHAGVARVLIRAAYAMGEGIEWLEVLAYSTGFRAAGRTSLGSNATVHMQMLQHLSEGDLQFYPDRFINALYWKLMGDLIGGVAYRSITRAAGRLGLTNVYSLTGFSPAGS